MFLLFSVIVAFNLNQISDALHQSIATLSKREAIQSSSIDQSNLSANATTVSAQPVVASLASKQTSGGSQLSLPAAAQPVSPTATEGNSPQKKPAADRQESSLLEPSDSTGVAAIQAFSGIASRFLVILPGLLLIGFAARRHTVLFNLREQYSHKWSIAASVEGFKIQAPSYREPIAAAVFTELLTNPAQVVGQASNHRKNGFIDRLIKPVVDRTLERMGVIPEKGGAD